MPGAATPPPEGAPPTMPGEVEPVVAMGTLMGRYVVLDPIGRGGMGVVYAAYDPGLDRRVAIKLLRRVSRDRREQERMLSEGMTLGRLAHPNVVAVYDVGTFSERHFVAMELVEGETLRAWTNAARPWREIVAMYVQAGRGLAAAHAAGVVHRDFKPDNVLIGRDGRARVLDFGVAQSVRLPDLGEGAAAPEGGHDGPTGRGPGAIVGTPRYMPLEQLMGEEVDERADQFAFCAALWEALCGRAPFEGRDVLQLLEVLRSDAPREGKGRALPGPVRAALQRGLSAKAASRFPSMNELLAQLSRAAAPPSRLWMGVGAALAAAIVGGTALGRATFARPPACPTAAQEAAELAGVWDDAVVAKMRASFAATGAPDAADTAERVKRKVDDFAARWIDARGDVCRSAHDGSKPAEDVYRLRMDCLDRERGEARAATALLAHADTDVVERGLSLAYGLPDVRWCSDVPALRAAAGLPDDPQKRRQAIALRDRMAEVSVEFDVGRAAEALEKITAVVDEARALGHPSTTAMALDWKGALLTDTQPDEGYALLLEALWLALGSGDKELAVEVSADAAKRASVMNRPNEAHQWLAGNRVLLASLGEAANGQLRSLSLYAEAFVADNSDRQPEAALAMNEQMVEIYRHDLGVDPRLAQALFNVASTKSELGRYTEARPLLEEALAMYESIGGERSRDVAVTQYGLGTCLLDLGELDRGMQLLATARVTLQEQGFTFWLGATLAELSRGHLLRDEVPEAVVIAQQALQAVPADDHVSSEASVVEGDGLNRLGRFAEARAVCEQAATRMQGAGLMDTTKVYPDDALRCEAEALLGLRRAAEALPLLERSLGFAWRAHVADDARAELAMARVLRSLHREPERVRTLAEAARDELARWPYLAPEKARAEGFLKELGSTGR